VRKVVWTVALGICLAALALGAAAATAKQPKRYYLSLGDSLAAGVQPGPDGAARNTRQGFAYQLARRAGRVKLVNYGCGWATSGSFIDGSRPCLPVRRPGYANKGPRTSQLAAAERFLRRHRERVAFVTIDIGANDVAACAAGGGIDLECVTRGVEAIERNVPKIAHRLRAAAGPRVPMAAMTLYDPFLASWFDGPGGKLIAKVSQDLARDQVNAVLIRAFRRHGFEIADVARRMRTYAPFSTDGESTGTPPLPVRRICRLTWMCAPAPRGPDIHANKAGYRLIATTFARTIGRAAR